MESALSVLPSIDRNTAVVLEVVVPLIAAFLISLLLYSWINNSGRQSVGFSPVVAAVLTAPLLEFAYFAVSTTSFTSGGIGDQLPGIFLWSIVFGPSLLVLAPLLVIYLRGGFRKTKAASVILSLATVACLALNCLWIYFFFGFSS